MKFKVVSGGKTVYEGSFNAEGGAFVELRIDGYGEKEALDGEGALVAVEAPDGIPVVHVFEDITVDGPTHSIRCNRADETRRGKA